MSDMPKIVPHKPVYNRPKQTSSAKRGYGALHRRLREQILSSHPICQVCGTEWATDLHHVDRNTGNRSPDNLLAVCEACHHGVCHR